MHGNLPAGNGAHCDPGAPGPPARPGYEYEGEVAVRVRRLPADGQELGAGLGGSGLGRELQLEWIRAGLGECRYAGGREWYRGEWAADRRDGRGRAEFADGGAFDGRWAADRPQDGCGRLVDPAPPGGTGDAGGGWVYEGELAGGRRQGRGECAWPDGTRYDGKWRAGRRWGSGPLCGPDGGCRYDGAWADDVRAGAGIAACVAAAGGLGPAVLPMPSAASGGAAAVRYEGEFEGGAAQGRGRGAYADGSRCAAAAATSAVTSPTPTAPPPATHRHTERITTTTTCIAPRRGPRGCCRSRAARMGGTPAALCDPLSSGANSNSDSDSSCMPPL